MEQQHLEQQAKAPREQQQEAAKQAPARQQDAAQQVQTYLQGCPSRQAMGSFLSRLQAEGRLPKDQLPQVRDLLSSACGADYARAALGGLSATNSAGGSVATLDNAPEKVGPGGPLEAKVGIAVDPVGKADVAAAPDASLANDVKLSLKALAPDSAQDRATAVEVLGGAEAAVEADLSLPQGLTVHGAERDVTLETGKQSVPQMAQSVAAVVREQILPPHLEGARSSLGLSPVERAARLVERLKLSPEVAQALALQVEAWKSTPGLNGFDILLEQAPEALASLVGQRLGDEKLMLACNDAFFSQMGKTQEQQQDPTRLVAIADIHGSEYSIADRVAMANPALHAIMKEVKRAGEAKSEEERSYYLELAREALEQNPELTEQVNKLGVQFTGDLVSKGPETLQRYNEVQALEAVGVGSQGGGIGFVHGNHEFSLARFLRDPNRENFVKFYYGWWDGKEGWQLVQSATEDAEFTAWKEEKLKQDGGKTQVADVKAAVHESWDRTWKKKEEKAAESGRPAPVRAPCREMSDELALGWIYMKEQKFNPEKKGSLGEFLFDKNARLFQLRKVGERALLFSHGDVSEQMAEAITAGIAPEMSPQDKFRLVSEHVDAINEQYRQALLTQDPEAWNKLDYGAIFAEYFHAMEGGRMKQAGQFKKVIDLFELAGIGGHFSGHTPQLAQGGGQSRGGSEDAGFFKLDVDESGDLSKEHRQAGNVASITESGQVTGYYYRDRKLQKVGLGKAGR